MSVLCLKNPVALREHIPGQSSIMVDLRAEEKWAAGCVQAALRDVTVGQHDDNSAQKQHAHDLDLSIAGGRTFAALEITAAADQDLIECWTLINGRDGRWIEPGIAGGWSVTIRPTARYKRLVKELPLLLREMEQVGLDRLPRQRAGWDHLVAAAKKLDLVWAHQGETSFCGSIYVMPEIPPERTGGWAASTGDALAGWLSEWIPSQSNKLSKLRRSGAVERHLFVIAPGMESVAPFSVTDLLVRADAPLPTVPPTLPDEVTHVWITGAWAGGQGFRWSPERGWETFANDARLNDAELVGCTC